MCNLIKKVVMMKYDCCDVTNPSFYTHARTCNTWFTHFETMRKTVYTCLVINFIHVRFTLIPHLANKQKTKQQSTESNIVTWLSKNLACYVKMLLQYFNVLFCTLFSNFSIFLWLKLCVLTTLVPDHFLSDHIHIEHLLISSRKFKP